MQSYEWGEFKKALGWQATRIGIKREGRLVAGAQILLRSLPLAPWTIAYVPKGPLFDPEDTADHILIQELHRIARSRRAVLLKIEPNLLESPQNAGKLKRLGFQPSALTNQPRSTLVLDLCCDEDAILSGMRAKTRKLIRRAAREGVTIEQADHRDIGTLYRILQTTAKAKGFAVHSRTFYEQAWNAFRNTDNIALLLARHQGQVVAAKMVLTFGTKSMHLWGGTIPHGRQIYASYLLQWKALEWAMQQGCTEGDLWGIPDETGRMHYEGQAIPSDRLDGLWGVYQFKRGFGGRIEYYVGAYDHVYHPILNAAISSLARLSSVDILSRRLEQALALLR